MWNRFDFEKIEELYIESSEEYTVDHENSKLARTFLCATQNLHDFRQLALQKGGDVIEDRQLLQLMYLHRGIESLRAVYWTTKHHCYSASFGRLRFLFELYIVVREWNRDKADAKQKWNEHLKKIKENEYDYSEALPLTEYFSGKKSNLKGELAEDFAEIDMLYNRMSNFGSHPHSVRSAALEGDWNESLEEEIFTFGLIFVFALAAQYVRTFEDSPMQEAVREDLDDVFVQVLLVTPDLPLFLKDDLEFGSQILP
jgi:hypothetical protein